MQEVVGSIQSSSAEIDQESAMWANLMADFFVTNLKINLRVAI
jgi:hypothetical protein